METLWNDGIMEVTVYPEGWLFLRWMKNHYGHLQRKLLLDFMQAERYVLTNGLNGWFTSSELPHREFQRLLYRIGARFMMKDKDFVYMNKWILKDSDLYIPGIRKKVA